ncbi:MAG: arginine--tRNA ligase [Gemmatimonadetes bacterium]|nr:arginine--tRNA ligase [Gemmatimonadota bacterium]
MGGAERLREALARIAGELGAADIEIVLERPRDAGHGDLSSNLALKLAGPLKQKPRAVAEIIVSRLDLPKEVVSKIGIAGPGFINFWLAEEQLSAVLPVILRAGSSYGRSSVGKGQPVNVEFVSANPTGPLHVGHGRQAAIGDAIAALLQWTGWKVTREFYYNDAGAQITNLGLSVQARIQQLRGRDAAIPEGGYHGDYVRDIAEQYLARHPEDPEGKDAPAVRRFAVQALREEQDHDLRAFGVKFDVYFLESSLYTSGKVEQTVKRLDDAGHTYEKEGASWLRTTDFGDDKDRVMRKSAGKGGEYTYFVPDVAYHWTKWERGFRRAINVQGADHHSTVTRVRVGLQALEVGIPQGYPEYVLHQIVTVMKGGEEVKISKRAGSYVTVRDLVDQVGQDAMRYFLLMRKADSHFVFDLDLATKQSEENPVYYVQYAHTRMAGILRTAGTTAGAVTADGVDLSLLTEADEQELMKHLAEFPTLVERAAENLEPHRVIAYLDDLARLANGWYHRHRVIGVGEAIEKARLVLVRAVQIVLANGLNLIGVTAPERM